MEKKFEFSKSEFWKTIPSERLGFIPLNQWFHLSNSLFWRPLRSQEFSYRLLQAVLESFSPLNFFLLTSKILSAFKTHYTLVVTDPLPRHGWALAATNRVPSGDPEVSRGLPEAHRGYCSSGSSGRMRHLHHPTHCSFLIINRIRCFICVVNQNL